MVKNKLVSGYKTMKCQFCKNVEEVAASCKKLTCEDCVECQPEAKNIQRQPTRYSLVCCKCKESKATNYNILKEKTANKTLHKYICKECKK